MATLAGFDVIATPRRYLEPHLNLELGGVPRSSFSVDYDELRSDRPLGIVVKLENRAADLERTRDRIQASEHDVAAEADRARSDYGQPFAHTQALTDARAHSAQLASELAERDQDRHPAGDPPAEVAASANGRSATRPADPSPTHPTSSGRDWNTQPPRSPDEHAQMARDSASTATEVVPPGGWTDADRVQPTSRDTSSYLSAQRYPLGTDLTVYAVGEDGPGRRLGHGVVVDHPSPHHVTIESPFGTKRVAAISHISLSTVETKPPAQTPTAVGTPAQKWAALCDAVDERITTDPHWPALAAQLDRAATAGTDIGALLHQVTADNALPDDHPARSLAYRVADVVPDLHSPARMRTDPDPAPRTAPPPPPPSLDPDPYRPGPRR